MNVVWFKRDLRITDHAALVGASALGNVLPLYIIEPELWQQPDMSYRQYAFLQECLEELNQHLSTLGQSLVVRVGNVVEVLTQLDKEHSIATLWSHQETWNYWTYERDKQVVAWARHRGIPWHEPTQNGVVRRLKNRDGWALLWHKTMSQSVLSPPKRLSKVGMVSENIPSFSDLGLLPDHCSARQEGGRQVALEQLASFLYTRGQGYTKEMSSPITAYQSCSRLSPYLAFGTLSIREVFQAVQLRIQEIKKGSFDRQWFRAMQSFSSRLRWHCHFMQKLEDQPEIEFYSLHPTYEGLRDQNTQYLEAWKHGCTGYPMIDACMRMLIATGWLNFRMRAMLMSFASYHLWLDWREPALHLARLFVDYEPGIHYSQAQMQSGTTGINSIRIYNPIKQGVDNDPTGEFIRYWIPELSKMPLDDIHMPWKNPELMGEYPMPIVDEKVQRKKAADVLYGWRKNAQHKKTASAIVKKHASRKQTNKNSAQMELPWE